jgi:hypothetical protein
MTYMDVGNSEVIRRFDDPNSAFKCTKNGAGSTGRCNTGLQFTRRRYRQLRPELPKTRHFRRIAECFRIDCYSVKTCRLDIMGFAPSFAIACRAWAVLTGRT